MLPPNRLSTPPTNTANVTRKDPTNSRTRQPPGRSKPCVHRPALSLAPLLRREKRDAAERAGETSRTALKIVRRLRPIAPGGHLPDSHISARVGSPSSLMGRVARRRRDGWGNVHRGSVRHRSFSGSSPVSRQRRPAPIQPPFYERYPPRNGAETGRKGACERIGAEPADQRCCPHTTSAEVAPPVTPPACHPPHKWRRGSRHWPRWLNVVAEPGREFACEQM